jgi:hypothetical protein
MLANFFKAWFGTTRSWSIGIYEGCSPFNLQPATGVRNPVISMLDVTDVPAKGVADPFLVYDAGRWYMFFEVVNALSGRGEIAYATSSDGLRWKYERVVLCEPFHLSYPYIVRWNHRYYMVPESHQGNSIRLYEAVRFPNEWRFMKQCLAGGSYFDPSLFFHNGLWWMYVMETRNERPLLRLFFSAQLLADWEEHNRSPVALDDMSRIRCAGRVVVIDGQPIRFAQDCSESYGRRVRAFRVTRLSRDVYTEEEVSVGPGLSEQRRGWNAIGMHHVDAQQSMGGRWIAAVDGCRRVPVLLHRWCLWRLRKGRLSVRLFSW